MRIDKYLVKQGYFESRNRAIETIKNGDISIDGRMAKPSTKVDEYSEIKIKQSKFYVSRAAKKLERFLQEHLVGINGKRALDIGSSTGGFAQIILENDVKSLDCVDVGHDQLHHSLRNNSVINLHEETDIRSFKSEKCFSLVTCDVSFISILQIIDDINRLSCEDSDIVILYKPQFEVGKDAKRDNKGVLKNQDIVEKAMNNFEIHIKSMGWKLVYKTKSRLTGKEGNIEYIYHFTKSQSILD